MNLLTKTAIAITCAFCWVTSAFAAPMNTTGEDAKKDVEVMILGVFHFAGAGNHPVKVDTDNFLSPKRQQEVAETLERLKEFAPDKIMVELDNKREAAFNKEYQAYLEGSHTLKADERQQLGMRLAKTLHHKQLYAMDSSGALERRFWDWGKTLELAKELKQNKLLSQHKALIAELTKSAKAESGKHTIDRLINLNTDYEDTHRGYMILAQMGSHENMEGALSLVGWWERNLKMYGHIAKYSEPGDRILVIVGAGHKLILERMFNDADGFTTIDPVPYLQD